MAGSRDAVEVLLAQAGDRDKNVRNRVARELARFDDPEARAAIREAAHSREWRQRFAVARAVRTWPEDQRLAADDLEHLLVDDFASVRWAAVRAVPNPDRLHALANVASSDPAPTVRQAALLSLALTRGASPILIASLKNEDVRVRLAAAHALRRQPSVDALGPLTLALRDPYMWVRRAAIWAIAEIGGPDAAPTIIPLLHDRKRPVRMVAASALGRIGDRCAVEPLLAMLERATTGRMKWSAIIGLGHLNDPRAVAPIIQALLDAWDDDPRHPIGREGVERFNVRRHATKALLRMDSDEAAREIERLPEDWVEWVDSLRLQ